MRVVDGGGLRDSRQSALELMIVNRELSGAIVGSQSAVAPSFPTAVAFCTSLP
jgi:hypothetical protein